MPFHHILHCQVLAIFYNCHFVLEVGTSRPVNPPVFSGNLPFRRCHSWCPILVLSSPILEKKLTKKKLRKTRFCGNKHQEFASLPPHNIGLCICSSGGLYGEATNLISFESLPWKVVTLTSDLAWSGLTTSWWMMGNYPPRTIWTTSGVPSADWNLLMAPTDSPQSASWWRHWSWCAYLTAMTAVRGHSACWKRRPWSFAQSELGPSSFRKSPLHALSGGLALLTCQFCYFEGCRANLAFITFTS